MADKYFTRNLPVQFGELRRMYQKELGSSVGSFTRSEIRRIRAKILERIVKQRRRKYFKSFVYLSVVLAILAVIMYFFLVNWGHSVAT